MPLKLIESAEGVRFTVKAVPGASRDKIVGELGEAMKIAVSAAPERGAANRAIVELLAERLNVHASRVEIVKGHTSPRKELFVRGVTAARIIDALNKH